jgi:hypothetical protein
MIWPAISRLFAVGFGFILALIGGAVTLFLLGSRWAASEASAYSPENIDEASRFLNEWLGVIAFFFTVAPVLTLLPALAAAVIGEVARIRSLLYYLVAGGAAAALMPIIATRMGEVEGATYATPYFTIMATAGFAAGLIYWLIAGRNA